MKELKEKNKKLVICSIVMITLILLFAGYEMATVFWKVDSREEQEESQVEEVSTDVLDYDIKLIKEVNEKENYLISPYSIEIALSMLKEGADGNTKKEIENLIGNREINSDLNVKNKVNIANGVFIKNQYKDAVIDTFYETVKEKYKADIIYDDLKSPKVVNDWVNKKTYNMIPKLFDELEDPLIVLTNAVALNVEWKYAFECKNTTKSEFIKNDGTKIDVSMMHQNYSEDAKYFETDNAKGVILPYQAYDEEGNVVEKGKSLEFVGILPNDNVESYIKNLTSDEINSIDDNLEEASEDEDIRVSLPSFSYDYTVKEFVEHLKNLGINDAFTPNCDLSKMIKESSYVSDVAHKTFIEVDEKGTKAAAATGVVVTKNAISSVKEIAFDKPFVYMIRDSKTHEMLFFGTVYEPNKWTEKKC